MGLTTVGMQFVPRELLPVILNYLPTKTLIHCQRVCRLWQETISKSDLLKRSQKPSQYYYEKGHSSLAPHKISKNPVMLVEKLYCSKEGKVLLTNANLNLSFNTTLYDIKLIEGGKLIWKEQVEGGKIPHAFFLSENAFCTVVKQGSRFSLKRYEQEKGKVSLKNIKKLLLQETNLVFSSFSLLGKNYLVGSQKNQFYSYVIESDSESLTTLSTHDIVGIKTRITSKSPTLLCLSSISNTQLLGQMLSVPSFQVMFSFSIRIPGRLYSFDFCESSLFLSYTSHLDKKEDDSPNKIQIWNNLEEKSKQEEPRKCDTEIELGDLGDSPFLQIDRSVLFAINEKHTAIFEVDHLKKINTLETPNLASGFVNNYKMTWISDDSVLFAYQWETK